MMRFRSWYIQMQISGGENFPWLAKPRFVNLSRRIKNVSGKDKLEIGFQQNFYLLKFQFLFEILIRPYEFFKKDSIKLILIVALMLSSQAYAYYDASADYSHGAQSYDEYVLGAPSRAHECPDTLTPTIIRMSPGTLEHGQGNGYIEGQSETYRIIIKDGKIEMR